ncbi:MAG: cytochrome c biogenesis protein CcsA [Paracoccaceae bacterium]
MLLWVFIVALFGAMAAWFGEGLPPKLKARVLAVQASIGVAFLGFIIFTSNPFARLAFPPFDGQDLNPLLQDPGLAFHPPFLYLGYVGLSMAFSFAVAALIEGKVDAAWARWVRPWTLAAWVFLTIGIGLGSWWAYYEFRLGRFLVLGFRWKTPPFMPWLFVAALLHSAIVVEKREALKSWIIPPAILAFGFSLIGTFLVRSGIITSVHAFATDPTRGVFILFILAFFTGGALTLFAARAQAMEAKGVFGMVSRESALVLNNILLAVSSFVVFTGTVWPLVAEMLFDRSSVGAPFEAAFTPSWWCCR